MSDSDFIEKNIGKIIIITALAFGILMFVLVSAQNNALKDNRIKCEQQMNGIYVYNHGNNLCFKDGLLINNS